MLVILDDDRLWSVGVGTESARPLELPSIQLAPAQDETQDEADTANDAAVVDEN
jgi:hypothetical protein